MWMLEAIISGLSQPFELLFNPSSRIYWLYSLSSILIALIFLYVTNGRNIRLAVKPLISSNLWLTRSSALDGFWLFTNSVIRAVFIIPYAFSYASGAVFVHQWLLGVFGTAPQMDLPTPIVVGVFTLVFFIVGDFSRFLLHWLMHKIPVLWQCHKVHHSAEQLTPITLYRMHPVEMALYYFRSLTVFSGVVGVFLYLFAGKLSGFTVLGVNVFVFLFNVLGANLRHSPVALSYGRFERWFISPVQHQIHHSTDPRHFDKNFGSVLAVWDRMANSWFSGVGVKKLSVGLDTQTSSNTNVSVAPSMRDASRKING
ncbi:sterol desaturase family protein [Sessilibacter corallicola]|uniref:sterol desaturase family protein n=1 Tax=Sessilibacter corallicola TaxID=2904075 RepID=UPI001E3E96C0|nr:sterol desaturase family protein [Sessilibacter corallicola]MCE2027013.1 sterol desaturase family protein [Sessilibacter corallicola]